MVSCFKRSCLFSVNVTSLGKFFRNKITNYFKIPPSITLMIPLSRNSCSDNIFTCISSKSSDAFFYKHHGYFISFNFSCYVIKWDWLMLIYFTVIKQPQTKQESLISRHNQSKVISRSWSEFHYIFISITPRLDKYR